MNETLDCIPGRRSIRVYQEQAVNEPDLELLLRAAMAAPNTCNSQPWEFIVITEKEVLDRLRQALFFGHYNASAAIVVCGNPEIANSSAGRIYWMQDCCAATSLGLDSVWIGLFPSPAMQAVMKVLSIPPQVMPLSLIHIGYPAEKKEPRNQYNPHRVYWQHYEPRKHQAKQKNSKYR